MMRTIVFMIALASLRHAEASGGGGAGSTPGGGGAQAPQTCDSFNCDVPTPVNKGTGISCDPTTGCDATTCCEAKGEAKYIGSFETSATGLTEAQMETAAKAAVAAHFEVDANTVKITVTKSRRLSADPRDLQADTWTVAYQFTAPAAKVAAVDAKNAAVAAGLPSVVGTKLVAAGAPQSAVNTMVVTASPATKAAATCDSYTCSGATPFNKGNSVTCSATDGCDTSICCEAPATCDSYIVCMDAKPVNKGSSVKCSGPTPSSCDISTCCEAEPTCASYTCSGCTPVNKGTSVTCSAIDGCDTSTCCKAMPELSTTYEILVPGVDPIVNFGDTITVQGTGSVIFRKGDAPIPFLSDMSGCDQPTLSMSCRPMTGAYRTGAADITGWDITGWDNATEGMKLGEKRRITVPAARAACIGDPPAWLAHGGYGVDGWPPNGLAGTQEYYESFEAFKNAGTDSGSQWKSGDSLEDGNMGTSEGGKFWDTSEVESAVPQGGQGGACTEWMAFAPGWQHEKTVSAGLPDAPAGSQVKRFLDGTGTAILELEDCYGDGHIHPGLAGTGTQVFYNGQKVGPTIKGQRHTFQIDFNDGLLVIGEVHSIWKVHSFKIYKDMQFDIEVLDTFTYLGTIPGVKTNTELVRV